MIFRTRFVAKLVAVVGVLSLSSTPAHAEFHSSHKHLARQDPKPCVPPTIFAQVGPGNGGRKIGIVIGASDSMAHNDPNDIRLAASMGLIDVLISESEAIDGKKADLVTLVDFASS